MNPSYLADRAAESIRERAEMAIRNQIAALTTQKMEIERRLADAKLRLSNVMASTESTA